jgi:hypothetical protein
VCEQLALLNNALNDVCNGVRDLDERQRARDAAGLSPVGESLRDVDGLLTPAD